MTQQQAAAEEQYLDLYSEYLDESDRAKRTELIKQMNEIERANGWQLA